MKAMEQMLDLAQVIDETVKKSTRMEGGYQELMKGQTIESVFIVVEKDNAKARFQVDTMHPASDWQGYHVSNN